MSGENREGNGWSGLTWLPWLGQCPPPGVKHRDNKPQTTGGYKSKAAIPPHLFLTIYSLYLHAYMCVCVRACVHLCVCPTSWEDRKRASERNSKEKLEREQSVSEGECVHLLYLCWKPCPPPHPPPPHFPGYFSSKCCSTHCRRSQGSGEVGTEPREQEELKVHEHAHTGMPEERAEAPWCIMHEALPQSAHLSDNYLCQINYQFKCQQEDVDEIHPDYLH